MRLVCFWWGLCVCELLGFYNSGVYCFVILISSIVLYDVLLLWFIVLIGDCVGFDFLLLFVFGGLFSLLVDFYLLSCFMFVVSRLVGFERLLLEMG